jgi:hypothetical protein
MVGSERQKEHQGPVRGTDTVAKVLMLEYEESAKLRDTDLPSAYDVCAWLQGRLMACFRGYLLPGHLLRDTLLRRTSITVSIYDTRFAADFSFIFHSRAIAHHCRAPMDASRLPRHPRLPTHPLLY